MSVGVAAAPADAATQEGLVNVAVTDITVQVPIAVAANVCDVSVNVLAEQLDDADNCDAIAGAHASQRRRRRRPAQQPERAGQPGHRATPSSRSRSASPRTSATSSANVLARQLDDAAPCDAVADPDAGA